MQGQKTFEEEVREELNYLNDEDDELQASLDIDLFDKKIKQQLGQKVQIHKKNQNYAKPLDKKQNKEELKQNIDDMKEIQQTFKQMIQGKPQKQQPAKQISKVDEITHQIVSKKSTKKSDKQGMSSTMTNFKQTTKDLDLNLVILSKDVNLKNQTIRELMQKNKTLEQELDKEKSKNQNLGITIQKLTEELGKLAVAHNQQKTIKPTVSGLKKK